MAQKLFQIRKLQEDKPLKKNSVPDFYSTQSLEISGRTDEYD